MSDLHVVFGTGPAGTRTAAALLEAGYRVRAVNRTGKRGEFMPDDVEVVAVVDASDAQQSVKAAEGASVVYQCLNPPYHQWPELFPGLQRGVVAAARAAGARYVSLENLYALGRVTGPMTEQHAAASVLAKGRGPRRDGRGAASAQRARRAGGRDRPRGRLLRSGRHRLGAWGRWRSSRCSPARRCRSWAALTCSTRTPTSRTWVAASPLWARSDSAFGRVWNLPHAPALTGRESLAPAFKAAGKPEKVGAIGPLTMRIGALFMPVAKESLEMLYEFTEPFVVDSSAIEREFGLSATPLVEGMARTVEWFRNR